MPRPIDHIVLAVPDLAAAADLYRRMGFTVGSANRHPWGTENAVVALDGSYLELIGLGRGFDLPPEDDPAAPFARPVAAAVARGGGLALLALGSEDADADAARFAAAGVGFGRRLDFARNAEAAGGAPRRLRFDLAFAALPDLSEAGLFACRHHQPFGDAAGRRHPNGAVRLEAVLLALDAPSHHAPAFAAVLAAPPEGPAERPSFPTATGRLDLMTPADASARLGPGAAPGRFAGFSVIVEALAPVRRALDAARIPHAAVAGAAVVPASHAFGAALAFAPAPCHSVP